MRILITMMIALFFAGLCHAQLVVQNSGEDLLMTIDNTGLVTMMDLQGSGTRMVVTDASGTLGTQSIPTGDNLGNHTMSTNLQTNGHWLSSDGNSEGVWVAPGGNVGIGAQYPAAKLQVNGSLQVGQSVARPVDKTILFGDGSESWIGYDNRSSSAFPRLNLHISGFGDASASDRWVAMGDNVNISHSLYLGTGSSIVQAYDTYGHDHAIHHWSGAYLGGGQWHDASSRRYKTDIHSLDLESARTVLGQLEPVSFRYKINQSETNLGFIAEDVPEEVASADRSGLAPMDFVAILTKIVQDQEQRIKELEEKLNE